MALKNATKQKLGEGKPVLGTFLVMGSPNAAEVLAATGLDYLMIDMEHGMIGLETAGQMINAMKGTGVTPCIRVAANDLTLIKQALDAGAQGVLIPMIDSKQDAERAVKACHYPPMGVRGVGAGHAALFGLQMQEYLPSIERESLVMLQIETSEAVQHIDEIVTVPGVDVFFIGPNDLASSLGVIGQQNAPALVEAIQKVVACCQKVGKALGIFCFSPEEVARYASMGFAFLAMATDSGLLATAAMQSVQGVRKALGE